MPTVVLPRPLVDRAGGVRQVDVEAGTVVEALRLVEDRHPRLRRWVLDESGGLRPHVKLFVGEAEVQLDTPLAEGDEIWVVQAISGGAS